MSETDPELVNWVLDGTQQWRNALVYDDLIVGQTTSGTLAGWRATVDGDISSLWRHDTATSKGLIFEGLARSIVATHGASMSGFAASTGEQLWTTELAGEPRVLTIADDKLWVAYGECVAIFDQDGRLVVEQPINMKIRWMRARGSTVDAWSEDEYVCLSKPAGEAPDSIMWLARNPLGITVETVSVGQDFAVLRKTGGKAIRLFRQFDSAWGQTVAGPGRLGDAGIDEENSRVFAALTTGEVVAWNAASGSMLWHSEAIPQSEELHPPSAPFLMRNYLVAGTRSGLIRIFDARSGSLLGRTQTEDQRRVFPVCDERFLSLGAGLRIYRLRA